MRTNHDFIVLLHRGTKWQYGDPISHPIILDWHDAGQSLPYHINAEGQANSEFDKLRFSWLCSTAPNGGPNESMVTYIKEDYNKTQ